VRGCSSAAPDMGDGTCPEAVKLNSCINPNGDVDVGDITLSDMSPDDIRVSLGVIAYDS